MDGVLSQEEISALLNSEPDGDFTSDGKQEDGLTSEEIDIIGEISNISMGTAATTLFSLVNHKVDISTPVVTVGTWEDIVDAYERPCVFIQIAYTVGLDGSNLLVLREHDVKVITDLMMGGNGDNVEDAEISELHLSAISEAMNQMMGSAATSLSSMLNKMIDISPPSADLVDLKDDLDPADIDAFLTGPFVKISFRMEIENLVNSEIMQLYPFSFAKEMCAALSQGMSTESPAPAETPQEPAPSAPTPQPMPAQQGAMPSQPITPMLGMPQQAPMQGMPMQPGMMPMQGMPQQMPMYTQQPVNVQPAQFQSFTGDYDPIAQQENIGLIMDVPLEVTVELGRTSKVIHDILEFAPGTIIELNKIAGEPIDVLVNGKYVAKGEVVVIEECFGVRITEIVNN